MLHNKSRHYSLINSAIAPLFLLGLLCIMPSCFLGGPTYYLGKYDKIIARSTRALEKAHDGRERAQALSERARGYGEKARYSRAMKIIGVDQYRKLFDRAVDDHRQAIELDPDNPAIRFDRGQTYYDRAALIFVDNYDPKADKTKWFLLAAVDFTAAIEGDPKNGHAYDMRGLVYEQVGELDRAIADYTQVLAFDERLGRLRLAGIYCLKGQERQGMKKYDEAIDAYAKSLSFNTPSDGCECEPFEPLVALLIETKRYDRTWSVIRTARSSGMRVSPENLERLKKESGRSE